jgi:hypothetical protein
MWNVGIAGKNRELTVHAASGRTAARPAMVAVPHDARARGEALIVINLAGRVRPPSIAGSIELSDQSNHARTDGHQCGAQRDTQNENWQTSIAEE